jgi:hypothetical protein
MRDIVDKIYDDGLPPKEALEIQKVRPISFLGKDILAIQKDVKPVVKHSNAYRAELARELRGAIEANKPQVRSLLKEATCGWRGIDGHTVDDHRIVDREPACDACVKQDPPQGIER